MKRVFVWISHFRENKLLNYALKLHLNHRYIVLTIPHNSLHFFFFFFKFMFYSFTWLFIRCNVTNLFHFLQTEYVCSLLINFINCASFALKNFSRVEDRFRVDEVCCCLYTDRDHKRLLVTRTKIGDDSPQIASSTLNRRHHAGGLPWWRWLLSNCPYDFDFIPRHVL